jgi:hypothetical protein
MNERIDLAYGPYRLIAAEVNGIPQAAAYFGAKERHRIEGHSITEALADLQIIVNGERERRQAERLDGVPQPAEFADALAGLASRLDVETRQLLAVHMRTPGRLLSVEELARIVRQDVERARKRYASFGRSLGALLEFAPKIKVQSREERPLVTFCEPHQDPNTAAIRWEIRNSAAAGFESHIRC